LGAIGTARLTRSLEKSSIRGTHGAEPMSGQEAANLVRARESSTRMLGCTLLLGFFAPPIAIRPGLATVARTSAKTMKRARPHPALVSDRAKLRQNDPHW